MAERHVIARLAHVLRNEAAALHEAKDRASEAEAHKRFQRSRHDQRRQQNPGGGLEADEKQHDGGSGQGGADPLRETLGWSGNKLDVPDPGRQHLH